MKLIFILAVADMLTMPLSQRPAGRPWALHQMRGHPGIGRDGAGQIEDPFVDL